MFIQIQVDIVFTSLVFVELHKDDDKRASGKGSSEQPKTQEERVDLMTCLKSFG